MGLKGFTYSGTAWMPLVIMLFLYACSRETGGEEEPVPDLLTIPPGFPEMVFPEDNQLPVQRWQLGKKLFYDPVLSVDGTLSCASCHQASLAFADDKAFSPGVMSRPGVRNAPSLANVGYHPYYLREGSVPTLEMQVLVPIQEQNEFAHDILTIAKVLKEDSVYVKMSREAYKREPDPYVITRALSTFQRTLVSGNSPFDQFYYQGNQAVLSESARRGMTLFFSERTQCSSCHGGFNFTDYSFRNNGLERKYNDPGRMRFTGKSEDEALFKVPSLRNVELTAPYMHNGSLHTLQEVVDHYNSGGKAHPNQSSLVRPLGLNEAEKTDLVIFLKSLTDKEFVSNPLFKP